MKKIRFLSIFLFLTLLFASFAPAAMALEEPSLECAYCVLLETNTGTVLYSRGAEMRAYPASLTKMMTVLLAVEATENQTVLPNGDTAALSNLVTAQPGFNFDMIADGSTADILQGETMTLEELLYCAMLSSANEACNVIAMYIGGNVNTFVEMMNQRAAQLGCTDTHFANTHGLPNEEHYTTALDLSLIARECVQHSVFRELCSTRTHTLKPTNLSAERQLYNTNALINANDHYPGNYLYEGAAGIKTGFTSAAGYCLAALATREGVANEQLLSIVLKAPAYDDNGDGIIDRYCNFSDSAKLFDWGFDNWGYREVLKSTDIITEVPVSMGDGADRVSVRPSSSIVRLLPNDEDLSLYQKIPTITATANGKELEAPIIAGQVLGEIAIVKDGVTVGTSALVASSDVALSRVQYMRTEISNTLHKPVVVWTFWVLILLTCFYVFVVVRYRNRRREYLKRQNNARIAREIAADDQDVQDWYKKEEEATRPVTLNHSSKLSGDKKTMNVKRSETGKESPAKKSGSGAAEKSGTERKNSEGDKMTEKRAPAMRPAAKSKGEAGSPTSEEDDSFRDCFEELFGKKE